MRIKRQEGVDTAINREATTALTETAFEESRESCIGTQPGIGLGYKWMKCPRWQ